MKYIIKENRIKVALCIFLNGLLLSSSFSQSILNKNNPFEQKVFIENKGQYDHVYKYTYETNPLSRQKISEQKILFSAEMDGMNIYFSKTSVLFNKLSYEKMTEDEIAKNTKKYEYEESEEKGKGALKPKIDFFAIEWEGANTNTQIMAGSEAPIYNTFADLQNGNDIRAKSFSSIIYKNIYNNIDIEYFFPKDSSGFKYNIILHPGANLKDVKMKYINSQNLTVDENGNFVNEASFCKLVEHAPYSYYSSNKNKVNSKLLLSDNIVTFEVSDLNKANQSGDIVIDPWVQTLAIGNANGQYNSAYDINYDNDGNVYVLGGYSPYKLVKFTFDPINCFV